jgi:hypothetical protein
MLFRFGIKKHQYIFDEQNKDLKKAKSCIIGKKLI